MKSRISISRITLCLMVAFAIYPGSDGQGSGKSMNGDSAIKGYDSVAYFKAGKAVKGNEAFSFQWHSMQWYFSSKANRDLFAATPERYAPQYDGYCAWAMAGARKAHTDPEVWEIVNGKLYLNCSRGAYEKWIKDIPGNIKKADANWLKFTGTK